MQINNCSGMMILKGEYIEIMLKQDYRKYLLRMSKYVKLSVICIELGINQGNFSKFLHGDDTQMKLENLEKIRTRLHEIIA